MAWYPRAKKYELQPESDAQPAIRPTQFIVHSIIAPWTAKRTYEYWRDSTNLESHFGLGYEGDLGQFIGTETRADANAGANRRGDGTGAVSVETASNLQGSDPWTGAQVEELIRLGVWLHQHHNIPLRICRTHSDPGMGWHSMFPQWSTSGTACPGKARIKQFREVVFPGIVARATGKTNPPKEDTNVSLDKDDVARIWKTDGILAAPSTAAPGNEFWTADSYVRDIHARIRAVQGELAATHATVRTLAEALASRDDAVDVEALIARITAAIEGVTVRLETE
ncbi:MULTISPECIES: N-acetylmuramoyl-L-alanine amidase [unclassified Streptomyces]|uniref:peptidoglycan recognition protein family protein n=1 Tax=unclassified Streptomyces TaxID=2593676 RepID=UPI0024A88311|nr:MULTISPECIES: N-acetylmuramoyl-L-alanine amidase [unclassified Streptomyces]